ncbi:hypothetical protein MMC25_006009 [Agyrium rufum]|nr:hypothetical protein [Agyrium rufum]
MLPQILSSLLFITLLPTTLTASIPSIQPRTIERRAPSVTYSPGQFGVFAIDSWFLTLDNDVNFGFLASNSDFFVYQANTIQWNNHVAKANGCHTNNCVLTFQADGNLVSYYNGNAQWSSNTAGRGYMLGFYSQAPFIVVFNSAGKDVWRTPFPSSTGGGGEPTGGGGGPGGAGGLCEDFNCIVYEA